MDIVRIGLIGTGRISDIYIENCQKFDGLEIIACASLDFNEAKAKAEQWSIPQACTPDEIFKNPDIDCVLNLTIPSAHAHISLMALEAGKHIYSEKPFVTNRKDGEAILALAQKKGLLVGNAPDTFLGGRWQTVKKMLDDGLIGKPLSASAFVGTHGVERHHPNPDFYYQKGGGPLLDLGPYYLTAMVFFFGAIAHVAGSAKRGFKKRMIENGPRKGEWMEVDIDTHINALMSFANGVEASITMSFDIWDSEMPRFEIYGENGTICIPDSDPVFGANIFGGDVLYRTIETSRWTHQPRPQGRDNWLIAENPFGYNENSRGLGLLDLAHAIGEKRQPRASGALALHVFDAMDAILKSASTKQFIDIEPNAPLPDPLPINFPN